MSASTGPAKHPQFVQAMGPVARELLGEPTEQSKAELRFGTHGSLSIDLTAGTWFNHENKAGGGLLEFVAAHCRTDKSGAVAWLQERGHLPRQDTPKATGKRQVAAYPYSSAAGELMYEVVRFDPKDFRQRRPDGNGGYIWKMAGVPLVLYRLPEVIATVAAGGTIHIVEGEKAADALAKIGVTATCSPGGAGKWRADYGRWLTGAHVVVMPDNDQAGRSHAQAVATALHGTAATLHVLELPNLPPKGDVVDWIETGGTAADLDRLASQTPRATLDLPGAEPERGRKFGRLRLLSVDDLLNAPPRDYILDGLLCPKELSVWWGPPKCGKSFLLLRIAYGMSQGHGMWGKDAVTVPVLYVAAEGDSGIGGRVRALHDSMGPSPNFHAIAQSVDLYAPDADLSPLIEAAKAIGAKLIPIDTLARSMGAGDENSTRDMNQYVRNCDRIREETGAHVAIIHHGGWDGSHARGSIALIGAADLVMKVEGKRGEPHAVTSEAAKDDQGGVTLGFALKVIDLPPDAKGKPRTTLIAIEADAELESGQEKRPHLHEEALTLLAEIHNALARGEGKLSQPESDMPWVPTLKKSILLESLIERDWLRVSSPVPTQKNVVSIPVSKGNYRLETVPKPEQTRLWKRLNSLTAKGIIGQNKECVWLVRKPVEE